MASDSPAGRAPLNGSVRFRLCAMMFLQFFIWGAWFELGFDYIPKLKFNNDWQLPLIFGAFNLGALVALFFSTQFADRKFAAEKFLAFSHLIGGLAIGGLAFLQAPMGVQPGDYNSVLITGQGDSETSGIGTMPDGTRVIVNGLEIKWHEFREKLDTFEKESDPEKKKDPRPLVTFLVTEAKSGELVGDAATPLAPFWPFFLLMLVHSLLYVPTISITNSIAFANLRDPARQFGPVRVWGTIGWIAASWPFIFILVDWANVPMMSEIGFTSWIGKALGTSVAGALALDMKRYIFLVAGIASLVLAAFSLTLPHTPPKPATGEDALAWLKAMKLLKHPFVLVLFIVTFIDAAVHQSFFYWTFTFLGPKADGGVVDIPANWVSPVMKIGQIAEIVTMLFLGYVLKNLGWRATMILGVLGHAARFAVFAYAPTRELAILINVLHGICYAFFFATVYIFVDEYFPKDVRSSAQGLFNVLILGLGPFTANFLCGRLKTIYATDGGLNYTAVFQYSMGAALLAALILTLFFHPRKEAVDPGFSRAEEDAPPAP